MSVNPFRIDHDSLSKAVRRPAARDEGTRRYAVRMRTGFRSRLSISLAFVGLLAAAPPARMVTLDVTAFDAKGRFAADLRPEELRVSDAGKPQRIAFFRRLNTIPHAVAILIDQLNGDLEQKSTEWNRALPALASAEARGMPSSTC
jgi:hypothetical protein